MQKIQDWQDSTRPIRRSRNAKTIKEVRSRMKRRLHETAMRLARAKEQIGLLDEAGALPYAPGIQKERDRLVSRTRSIQSGLRVLRKV